MGTRHSALHDAATTFGYLTATFTAWQRHRIKRIYWLKRRKRSGQPLAPWLPSEASHPKSRPERDLLQTESSRRNISIASRDWLRKRRRPRRKRLLPGVKAERVKPEKQNSPLNGPRTSCGTSSLSAKQRRRNRADKGYFQNTAGDTPQPGRIVMLVPLQSR